MRRKRSIRVQGLQTAPAPCRCRSGRQAAPKTAMRRKRKFPDEHVRHGGKCIPGAGSAGVSKRQIVMVIDTVLVGVTAEFLVDSINGLVASNPSLSAEWVGLILLPIVRLPPTGSQSQADECRSATPPSISPRFRLGQGQARPVDLCRRRILDSDRLFVIPSLSSWPGRSASP